MEIKHKVVLDLNSFSSILGRGERNLKPLSRPFIKTTNLRAPEKGVPWHVIQRAKHKYNFLVTINPDPRFDPQYNDKTFMLNHIYKFLVENSSLMKEYVCAMEEGKGKLHFHLIISSININVNDLKKSILRTYSTRSQYHHRTCLITKIKDYKEKATAQTLWIGEETDKLPDHKKYKTGYPYLLKENHEKATYYKKPLEI